MQVGQTSYRIANALSAIWSSATMRRAAGNLLCLLYLLFHLQKMSLLPFALVLLMLPAVVNLQINWAFCNCALPSFTKIMWVLKTDCIIGKFQRKSQSISIFAGGFFITTHQSGHRPHQSNKTRPATCWSWYYSSRLSSNAKHGCRDTWWNLICFTQSFVRLFGLSGLILSISDDISFHFRNSLETIWPILLFWLLVTRGVDI